MDDKILLVHPDDFARLQAEGHPVHGDPRELSNDLRIPLVWDNYGVCKPSHGFEIMRLEEPSTLDHTRRPMPSPPKLQLLDVIGDAALSQQLPPSRPLSLKEARTWQRRLDYASNVRRRKRWAEMRLMASKETER